MLGLRAVEVCGRSWELKYELLDASYGRAIVVTGLRVKRSRSEGGGLKSRCGGFALLLALTALLKEVKLTLERHISLTKPDSIPKQGLRTLIGRAATNGVVELSLPDRIHDAILG